jgi:hypothetical protein
MLTAVNRQIRRLPEHLHDSAEAVLARELARDFDLGYRTTSPRLLKVLEQLRKLAAPPKAVSQAADSPSEETEPDELDELARARADRLADAAGVVRAIGADKRRAGGRRAR